MTRTTLIESFRRRIQAHFPQLELHSIVTLQPGWDSVVMQVNGKYVFRFPLRAEVAAGLEKEIALLPALGEWLSISVPRFQFIARPARPGEIPFVGYPEIPGIPLSLEISQATGFPAQIARFLNQLHSFPAQKAVQLGVPAASPGGWRQEYVDFYVWIEQHILPVLSEEDRSGVASLWEAFLDEPENFSFQPVLIHRDLGLEHILCDPEQPALNGVIDWEDAAIGDPALDFAGLWFAGGRDFVEQVLAGYTGPVGSHFWERLKFYCDIGPFYEVRFGIETDDQLHRGQGLAALHRLINTI